LTTQLTSGRPIPERRPGVRVLHQRLAHALQVFVVLGAEVVLAGVSCLPQAALPVARFKPAGLIA
jgi:hypothetical protein